MLEEGTLQSDWSELADRVEASGMEATGFADYDGHGVAMDCLAGDLERALQIAAEMLAEPRFDAQRFDLVRAQESQSLEALKESPEAVTGWAFLEAIYRGGRRGVPLQGRAEDLDRLRPEDCRRFHEEHLATGAIVSVAGAIDEDEAARWVERFFEQVAPESAVSLPEAGGAVTAAGPAAASFDTAADVHIATDASEQAHLYLGHPTVNRAHCDRLPLLVLGTILGGGAGNAGRVPDRIREELGLAYSTYAGLVSGTGLDPGYVVLYAGTAAKNVEAAKGELRSALVRLVESPVADAELEGAVSFLLGREPFRRETGRQWANHLIDEEVYGLQGQVDRTPGRLAEMTPSGLLEVARRWIDPDALVCVVGIPRS